MASEKRLIPCGDKVTLDELPCGTLFAYGDDCLAVKSEYRCSNGLIEAFIIDSGEEFWGGVNTAKEQNELMVQPLAIEEVDAVEVVRCKECHWWRKINAKNGCGICRHEVFSVDDCTVDPVTEPDDFCSYGERRTDEQG